MRIQINTGKGIDGNQALKAAVKDTVEHQLARFTERLTRVEVHITDVNAHRGGRDTRCVMEARIGGMPPVIVDDTAHDWERASRGAVEKMVRALDSRLGRLGRRATIEGEPAPLDEEGADEG